MADPTTGDPSDIWAHGYHAAMARVDEAEDKLRKCEAELAKVTAERDALRGICESFADVAEVAVRSFVNPFYLSDEDRAAFGVWLANYPEIPDGSKQAERLPARAKESK